MRIRSFVVALVILVISGVGLAQAQEQTPAREAGSEAVPAVVAEEVVGPAAGTDAGAAFALPPRPAPPRTMADLWPVFLLFVFSWVGIIAYLLASGRRVARLAARLERWEGER